MKIFFKIVTAILCLILLNCATDYKRAPYGGPEDRQSPRINSSSLPDNSLNVSKRSSVNIIFSEFIDRNSTRNAIDISPRSAKKRSEVLWYDKSVEINFSDLDDNSTVVVSINPSLKDLRGNPLTDSYSLSFSTGDKIEKRKIYGRINGSISGADIISVNYSKVRINLYSLSAEDSLIYERTEPEYSSGIYSDLSFELKNLTSGIYKIIAFNDLNNDSKPQFDTEMLSFEKGNVDLVNNDSLNYIFTLGWNDVVSPFIKNTSLVSSDILKIEFSESLPSGQKLIDSLYINGERSDFEEFFSQTGGSIGYARTSQLKIGDVLKIRLNDIKDDFGNFINTDFKTKLFNVTDTIASSPFRITGKLPGKIAVGQDLSIMTNKISSDSIKINLLNEKDSTITELKKSVTREPYVLSTQLKDDEISSGSYELQLVNKDSVIVKKKITVEEDPGYGSISGTVNSPACDDFIIIFQNVEKGVKKTEPLKSGEYKSLLRPGKYLCAAFENSDLSGVFGMNIFKDITKNAVFYSDTVLVRKNWESTDVNINFNR